MEGPGWLIPAPLWSSREAGGRAQHVAPLRLNSCQPQSAYVPAGVRGDGGGALCAYGAGGVGAAGKSPRPRWLSTLWTWTWAPAGMAAEATPMTSPYL